MRLASSLLLGLSAALFAVAPALAQGSSSVGGSIPGAGGAHIRVSVPLGSAPSGSSSSFVAPTVSAPTPTTNSVYNAPQPIDLTNDRYVVNTDAPKAMPILTGQATDGLTPIAQKFPEPKDLSGNSDWILVRGDQGSAFTRPNPYTAKLENGTILVSVRRPSNLALVQTPIGDVALHSDGDVMLTWKDDSLRVYNLSALKSDCKAKLDGTVFGNVNERTIALHTGYELVACKDHKLGRREMRPYDGIARRRAQLVADGHIGVSEFSVQSVLQSSAMIAHIQAAHDVKEARVLAQMSKMAAVLNVVNSPFGYSAENGTGVAAVSFPH